MLNEEEQFNPNNSIELEELSSAKNTYYSLLLASGASYFGWYVGVYNILNFSDVFIKLYDISDSKDQDEAIGNINFLFTIGATLGVLCTGFLADTIGRTKSLLLGDFLAIIAAFGYLLKVPLWVTLIARFLSGLVAAIYSSINASMANELLPEKKATLTGTMIYSFLTGFLLITAILNYLPRETLVNHVNIILFAPSLLSLLRFILILITMRVESPVHIFITNFKDFKNDLNNTS
jgi:MFS family permease